MIDVNKGLMGDFGWQPPGQMSSGVGGMMGNRRKKRQPNAQNAQGMTGMGQLQGQTQQPNQGPLAQGFPAQGGSSGFDAMLRQLMGSQTATPAQPTAQGFPAQSGSVNQAMGQLQGQAQGFPAQGGASGFDSMLRQLMGATPNAQNAQATMGMGQPQGQTQQPNQGPMAQGFPAQGGSVNQMMGQLRSPAPSSGGGWASGGGSVGSMPNNSQSGQPTGGGGGTPSGGPTNMSNTGFNYPSQWGTAQQMYERVGNQAYQNPAAWQQGQDWMNQLWQQGGTPTNVSGMWNALMPQVQRAYKEGAQGIGENWGALNPGVSGGSGKNYAQNDMWSRLMENMASNVMGQGIQAQENATNRMYGLPGMAYQYGAGEAGNRSDYANRALRAAGGLTGLGSQYAQLPMQYAGLMGQLGQSLTNQQIDPWTQMMYGMVGNPQYTPQTYNPTRGQNFWNVIGNTDWGSIFGGGGNGSDLAALLAATGGAGGWA